MSDYDTLSDMSSALSSEELNPEELTSLEDDTTSLTTTTNVTKETEAKEMETWEASDSESETTKKEEKWEDVLGTGGLMKLIITPGQPDTRPQRMENCKLNYKCTLEDGTLVEEKKETIVQLGDCDVTQGLDLALGLMNVGEVSQLKVEPRFAYGPKGFPPTVPSETTVHYEVTLLSVEPEDDPVSLSISDRRRKGNLKRERGNWWYTRGENQLAIQCYRRALDYLDEAEGGIKYSTEESDDITDAALQQLLEDRINVSNNMAAAQLKLELYDAALQSLQTVLRCQPDNVKALFRKAKIHRAKNDVQSALSCLKKAVKIIPQDADILKEITSLERLKEKQKISEKELARRMFNGLQSNTEINKKRSASSKVFTWMTLGATVAIGVVGIAIYRFKLT